MPSSSWSSASPRKRLRTLTELRTVSLKLRPSPAPKPQTHGNPRPVSRGSAAGRRRLGARRRQRHHLRGDHGLCRGLRRLGRGRRLARDGRRGRLRRRQRLRRSLRRRDDRRSERAQPSALEPAQASATGAGAGAGCGGDATSGSGLRGWSCRRHLGGRRPVLRADSTGSEGAGRRSIVSRRRPSLRRLVGLYRFVARSSSAALLDRRRDLGSSTTAMAATVGQATATSTAPARSDTMSSRQ